MRWLLNAVYIAVAAVVAPLAIVRYLRTGKPVAEPWAKLTGRLDLPPLDRPIWIHAVSVGEVLQVRPLVDALRGRDPTVEIVITASTASGLRVASEKYEDCVVAPLPFDFSWAVDTAIARVRPREIVLVELELWPNLLVTAARRGIPVSVVSGRLSERSHRGYRRVRGLVRPLLRTLTHVGSQTRAYADRFRDLGALPGRVRVTGCLKHDVLANPSAESVTSLRRSFGIADTETALIAGSTHTPEEQIVLDAYSTLRVRHSNLRLILVPRHPERFDEVAGQIEAAGFGVARRSDTSHAERDSVGLLDTVGELAACWRLADVAFVGGSLTDRGGQNMLEPAAAGAAVLFGPNVWNFPRESAGLLDAGGAVQLADADSLAAEIDALLSDRDAMEAVAIAGRRFAQSLSGAADAEAARLVPSSNASRRAA